MVCFDFRELPGGIELTRRSSRLRTHRLLEKLFFAIHQRVDVVRRQLKPMPMSNRIGRASFHAITAKNAPRIVDIVDAGITLARRYAARISVLSRFNVNAVRRASRRAEETAYALLQTILVAMQNMDSAVPRLKMHRLVRIVLRHRLPEDVPESHAKALHQGRAGLIGLAKNGCHGKQ